MPAAVVHDSPFAGFWYPDDPHRLRTLIASAFDESIRRAPGPLLEGALGFVVPHAGVAYSGRVAAAAYRHLARRQPRTVIVLGFSHQGAPPGAWIPEIDAYRTPFGEVAVDREAVRSLVAGASFRLQPESVLCDHSVEIQLPLLQHACPEARIVPVYVSSLTPDEREGAARSLATIVAAGAVVIASSDFTHYGAGFRYVPFPCDRHTSLELRKLDEGLIEIASSIDAGYFSQTLRAESATVCGREAIALLLATLRQLPGDDECYQQTLDYETSGEITGDYTHSVSYAALGYFPWSAFQLDEHEKAQLLRSARCALQNYQKAGSRNPLPIERSSSRLGRPGAAFVTLRRGNDLRGCVGHISSNQPLAALVPELVVSAASEDRRFEPIRSDESDIAVEISILSPMKMLADRALLRAGVDGGYLKSGKRLSGLLLPQVASSRHWTGAEFLRALALKTGFPSGVFDDREARLFAFRAQLIQ